MGLARSIQVDAGDSTDRQSRLGIIHLLGWMLGCALVLAVLKAIGDYSNVPEQFVFRDRLVRLGFGLAYGTAFSGLGLFLWRWRTGRGPGPTQPGHWLLLFGGIALIIDLGAAGSVVCLFPLLRAKVNDWRFHLWHQTIGWSIAMAIAVSTLVRLRDASRLWTAFAGITATMLAVNWAANVVSLYGLSHGARGQWLWYLPQYAVAALPVVVLPLLGLAEIADRIHGAQRDWLHGGGIAAITALGIVSFLQHMPALWK
jgi:hypothetical protein